jgi:iron(III) transport system substrate-binding protein
MTHKLSVLASVVIAFVFVGARDSSSQNWEGLLQKLYPAAKKEGAVHFNGAAGDGLEIGGKEGIEKFSKRYPGIKIVVSGLSSSKLYPRIIAEARAGSLTVDMDVEDPPAVKPMIDRGLIAMMDPKELTDKPENFRFVFENKLPVSRHQITHLAYNTKAVPKQELPKTYEDLLNPRWKGKLAFDGRGMWGFTHLRILWGEEKFWRFIKAFPAQQPLWSTRCNSATDKVVTGEAHIGCVSMTSLDELKAKGAPVEFLPISPVFVRIELFAPFKNAPHPNASKLLIGWALSPEGVEATNKIGAGMAVPGTPTYDFLKAAGVELYFADRMNPEQLTLVQKTRGEMAQAWGAVK